jgi:uncharacterized protein YaeQ
MWWDENRAALARLSNVSVVEVPVALTQSLAALATRSMQLAVTVQERQAWIADAAETLHLELADSTRQ